jgi:hypothetical protein
MAVQHSLAAQAAAAVSQQQQQQAGKVQEARRGPRQEGPNSSSSSRPLPPASWLPQLQLLPLCLAALAKQVMLLMLSLQWQQQAQPDLCQQSTWAAAGLKAMMFTFVFKQALLPAQVIPKHACRPLQTCSRQNKPAISPLVLVLDSCGSSSS